MRLSLCAVLLALCGAHGFKLTKENYATATAGKNVFIKFFAPWCGHCQEIAPAWAKLMDEFKDSKTALVGEMDCATAPDDEAFCGELKVDGYPTIKYGKTPDMKDYEGGREFDDLLEHAKLHMGPTCGEKHLDLCSEEQKKQITDAQAMSDADITEALKTKADKITAMKDVHEKAMERLQAQQELAAEANTKELKELTGQGNPMLKAICQGRPGCVVPVVPKAKVDVEEEGDEDAAAGEEEVDEPEEPETGEDAAAGDEEPVEGTEPPVADEAGTEGTDQPASEKADL